MKRTGIKRGPSVTNTKQEEEDERNNKLKKELLQNEVFMLQIQDRGG